MTTLASEQRSARLTARDRLKSLTGLKRVADCGNARGAFVQLRATDGVGGFAGLSTCGSAWACPVCSAKIAAGRQAELAAAMEVWGRRGGTFALITLTVGHTRSDALAELWDDLQRAYRSLGMTYAAKVLRQVVAHTVRATEVTRGELNGWHVHYHVLAFVKPGADVASAAEGYVREWQAAVKRSGRKATRAAQDWTAVDPDDAADVGPYIAKGGYKTGGGAAEVTRADWKRSKGGRTQWDLLDGALALADGEVSDRLERCGFTPADGALWAEFEVASKGRRQLVWSKGAKEDLSVDEVTDEELAEEELGSVQDTIGVISAGDWQAVRRVPGRTAALVACVNEDPGASYIAAAALMRGWGLRFQRWDVRLEGRIRGASAGEGAGDPRSRDQTSAVRSR